MRRPNFSEMKKNKFLLYNLKQLTNWEQKYQQTA